MSDVVISVTVFHTVAALAVVCLMAFGAIKVVQDRFSSKD